MTTSPVQSIDPAQCPFRDTCPNLLQCVTEFLVDMAREDWGLEPERREEHGSDDTETI